MPRKKDAQSPRFSALQKNWKSLLIGDFGALLELRQGTAPNRVLEFQERIVRQAQHSGDVPRGDDKRLGAQHHRALAQLFEGYSIVQTAR